MWKCQLDEVITTTSPASFQSSPCHSLPRRCSLGFVTCSFPKKVMEDCLMSQKNICVQHIKKVVSDSPGLVDFAIRLVNSVISLPDGNSNYRRTVKSICSSGLLIFRAVTDLQNSGTSAKFREIPKKNAKYRKIRQKYFQINVGKTYLILILATRPVLFTPNVQIYLETSSLQ